MDQPSDIRNLSAHRPVSATVVELRSPAQLRPDLRDAIEPARRRFGRPQQVIREHTNNAVRWKAGERLNHVLEEACIRFSENDAVVTEAGTLSYRELDSRANQVARYLIEQGVQPATASGCCSTSRVETYIALLAVMKVNAAYVPLDAAFPIERLRFILDDAEIKAIVSMSRFARDARAVRRAARSFSTAPSARSMRSQDASRLHAACARSHDQLCYIIYTSGTTGKPKGVAIEHAEHLQLRARRRRGLRLSAGRPRLPGHDHRLRFLGRGDLGAADRRRDARSRHARAPPGRRRARRFPARARSHRDGVLPDLARDHRAGSAEAAAVLLVGGEACPQNLVARWHRPGRRILNAYGPTEATVTATLTELRPDKPVTIGVPLPTYTIVILDPNEDKTVAHGELGEIGIAGVGLALGYLNRDELTMKKFIPDFLNIPNNPSGRIYRTGDLGRINEDGEIEYHGRIDTQVKIRGYRIELTEIEAVLLRAAADRAGGGHHVRAGAGRGRARGLLRVQAGRRAAARRNLAGAAQPAAGLHGAGLSRRAAVIPMTLSNKADRKKLPTPQAPRFSARRPRLRRAEDRDRAHSCVRALVRGDEASTACRPRIISSRTSAPTRC